MGKTTSGRFLVVGLVGLALASVGCGDDGNALSQFVGTWKYNVSNAHLTCTDGTDQTGALTAMKRWGRGVSSDLVDLSRTCDYRFDVNDKKASIQRPQTCKFDDGSGTGSQATEMPNVWVFTLLSAISAEETMETVTTYIDTVSCTLTATSTLDKVSAD